MTTEPVVRLQVRAVGRVDDVICATAEPGVPLAWLRAADVLVLPEDSDGTAEQLFLCFPGCSVVVVTAPPPTGSLCRKPSPGGTRNLVHVRGGALPRAAAGDPQSLGALAHARGSLVRGRTEEADLLGPDRTVVVNAGPPRAD